MRLLHKILVNLTLLALFLILFYCLQTPSSSISNQYNRINRRNNDVINRSESTNIPTAVIKLANSTTSNEDELYDVWCIFTKVTSNSPMRRKFKIFTASLLKLASVKLAFHVITDDTSRKIAETLIQGVVSTTGKHMKVIYFQPTKLFIYLFIYFFSSQNLRPFF